MTAQTTEQILGLVLEYRCPHAKYRNTRKLYWLIKGKLFAAWF